MDTPDLEWKPGESQDPEPSFGIPLPKDIRVTNISLLPQPEQGLSRGHNNPRKAVVLVYSPDMASAECEYLVFKLQVFRNKVLSSRSVAESYIARRPFYVMAHTALRASMKHEKWLGPVTSVFIAGVCFQYDLRKPKRKKPASKIKNNEFLVTLGVNYTSGGIYAFSVFKEGKTCIACLSNFQASKYQLSDIVFAGAPLNAERIPMVRFVWNIELLNGDLISWSVPSFVAPSLDQFDDYGSRFSTTDETYFRMHGIKRPKGLRSPFLVCDEKCTDKAERLALGTLCEVGTVTDWAFQSSSGCQADISLGLVPQSGIGCVLRCGQKSQKFTRSQIGDIGNSTFSSNILDIMNTHSQSLFLITPPAFVISLYALLLEAASIRMDPQLQESSMMLTDKKSYLKVRNSRSSYFYYFTLCMC